MSEATRGVIDDVAYGATRGASFDESFDRIVFNFPCLPVAAGKDGNSEGSGRRTRLRSKKTRSWW